MEIHTMLMQTLKNATRTFRSTGLLTGLIAAMFTLPAFAGETIEDRWYVVELQNQRTGWMHLSVERDNDDRITTSTQLNLTISRGQITIPIEMSSVFIETADGEPVSMTGRQKTGLMPTESSWVFTEGKTGKVRVTSSQFGSATTKEIDPPDAEWMTPFAAGQYVERELENGATTIVTSTIDPAVGMSVVTTTASIKGKTTIEALGRIVPAVEWEATTSAAPGVRSVEYVDEAGDPIRTEVNFGGIGMSIILADKQLALSKIDPAELMVSTFVTPNRPIDGARHTIRGEYRLTLNDDSEFELIDTGSQTWERDGDAVLLRVRAEPGEYHAANVKDVEPFLASTTAADLTDPEIKALTERALQGAERRNEAEQAEQLRRFVHAYIDEKSLAVGFATASEVCRTRQGDCSEHGVLLAAMLRSAGIPSRVASGLIYADAFAGEREIFGYHMWSQALLTIDGVERWVDLDATLPDSTPYDATHITVAVSDLADDDSFNSMASLAPLLGKLEIEVVSVE